jgi:homocysteine S-methyltransferase
VLAGITPLESLRHAEFMANEVPGVTVPEAILERMRKAEEAGHARDEGLAIARELVGELSGRVQGLQITVPAGAFETALRVLDAIEV